METKTKVIRDYAGQLKLTSIQDHVEKLIDKAAEEKCSYLDFLLNFLQTEINHRSRSALIEYNKLLKAHLLVIDDIMMFAMEKKQAVQLFNFINHLNEKASFIVTTNKSPEEWVKMLDDEVIATALLDRILYRCEVVRLSGKSYRLENRKTIFN